MEPDAKAKPTPPWQKLRNAVFNRQDESQMKGEQPRRVSMSKVWAEFEFAPEVRAKAALDLNLQMPSLAMKADAQLMTGQNDGQSRRQSMPVLSMEAETPTMTEGSSGLSPNDWLSPRPRRKSMQEAWAEFKFAPDVLAKAALDLNSQLPSLAQASKFRLQGAASSMSDLPPTKCYDDSTPSSVPDLPPEELDNDSGEDDELSSTSSKRSVDSEPVRAGDPSQPECAVSRRLELARQQQVKLQDAVLEWEVALRHARGSLEEKNKEIEALEEELRNKEVGSLKEELLKTVPSAAVLPNKYGKRDTDASLMDQVIAHKVGNKKLEMRLVQRTPGVEGLDEVCRQWACTATMPELPAMVDDGEDASKSEAESCKSEPYSNLIVEEAEDEFGPRQVFGRMMTPPRPQGGPNHEAQPVLPRTSKPHFRRRCQGAAKWKNREHLLS